MKDTVPSFWDFPTHVRSNCTTTTDEPDYELFARDSGWYANGTWGWPSTDACAALVPHRAGNWWCWNGDQTTTGMADGGTPFAKTGTANSFQWPLCPNGPDCQDSGITFLDGGEGIFTGMSGGDLPDPNADGLTVCARFKSITGSYNWAGTYTWLVTKDNSGADNRAFTMGFQSGTGNPRVDVYNAAGSGTSTWAATTFNATTDRQSHVYCFTYARVDAGSVNRVQIYIDGVADGAATTTAVLLNGTDEPYQLNGRAYPGFLNHWKGFLLSAVVTEQWLTADEVLDLSTRMAGHHTTDSQGNRVTASAAGTRQCAKHGDLFAFSTIPANQPCITGGGAEAYDSWTNLEAYGTDLNAWGSSATGGGSSTVTSNVEFAGDLYRSVDKFTFTPPTGGQALRRGTYVTASAGQQYTLTYWIKGNGGSGTVGT
jgi:hypothetical protein